MAETPNQREGRSTAASGDIDPLMGAAPSGTVPSSTTGTGRRTTVSRTLATTLNKAAANALIEKELVDALGFMPNAKIKAEFFKGVNAYLKAYGSKSSTRSSASGSTSTSVQGADIDTYVKQFIGEVVKDSLKANPKIKFGGRAGDTIGILKKYSSDMGVFKSDNEIAKNSIDVLAGRVRQEDLLTKYRKDAQALYSNFAPRLAEDASLTVRDLANPYIQMMADTFEDVADNIKLTDDTIQKAINDAKGIMNLGEFRKMLRNDSRYGKTSAAKREAAELGTSMIRSMGFQVMAGEYAESLRGTGNVTNSTSKTRPKPKAKPKKKKAPTAPVVNTGLAVDEAITAQAEPTETEAQIAARVRAEEKAAAQADFFADAGAVFRGTLKTIFPGAENDTWINQLFEAAKPRLTVGFDTNEILDLMIQNGETPTAFNQRFKGIFELDKRRDAGETVYVPKIAEYVAGEEEYSRLMTRLGMSSLGTTENYGTLVGNDVSLDEVRDRVTEAYNRVKGLDDQVLAGLKEQFPSLKQEDLVQAVLTKETPNELENRIIRSEIGVEAKQAGVVSVLGAQALQEKGITRAQARTGFQALAEYQRNAGTGIAQAQSMFGDTTSATQLQTELESEALLGQTSKTRKRLESQTRAQFAGQSGIATGSLKRKSQV